MSELDFNVNNYTISELLGIIELDDPTSDDIINKTNYYIKDFSKKQKPELVNFFQSIQTKLLQYMNQLETDASETDAKYSKQTEEWIKYEALPQDNSVQKDKITDRIQKIDVYENNHVPMNREQLGVNNNFQVPVVQDTLNPNLENITSRFINLDSQFRQSSGGSETMATDYTMDLSDPLTNVLSLRLYSIQIPYTWYTIDYIYGNTCFWVTNTGSSGTNTFKIFIEPGNYSPAEFCTAINNAFKDVGFTYLTIPVPVIASYNLNNGKIKLNLVNWIDPSGEKIVSITQ